MYPGLLQAGLADLLTRHPVVGLLGPRQVGKTTLALAVGENRPSIYLDLESPSDLAKLAEPELFLRLHEDKLVILDEIQRVPGLFQVLRGLVDQGRRLKRGNGRFLVLGSAGIDLLHQSSESLAGRIAYTELPPLLVEETGDTTADTLWLRGGFPSSFTAFDDAASLEWRRNFIRTYLERDIPQLGPRIPAETLRRLWTMLAHEQGSMLNAARLAAALGLSGQTAGRYIDLLCDLLLVRRLTPWVSNAGKRMAKSPKVYVRDCGLAHALLGIEYTRRPARASSGRHELGRLGDRKPHCRLSCRHRGLLLPHFRRSRNRPRSRTASWKTLGRRVQTQPHAHSCPRLPRRLQGPDA